MVSSKREPITEVWGQSPERRPGIQPRLRESGTKAPEGERLFALSQPKESANLF